MAEAVFIAFSVGVWIGYCVNAALTRELRSQLLGALHAQAQWHQQDRQNMLRCIHRAPPEAPTIHPEST